MTLGLLRPYYRSTGNFEKPPAERCFFLDKCHEKAQSGAVRWGKSIIIDERFSNRPA